MIYASARFAPRTFTSSKMNNKGGPSMCGLFSALVGALAAGLVVIQEGVVVLAVKQV